nr:hypothetical protein [uncultured Pseudomonas sp.]
MTSKHYPTPEPGAVPHRFPRAVRFRRPALLLLLAGVLAGGLSSASLNDAQVASADG